MFVVYDLKITSPKLAKQRIWNRYGLWDLRQPSARYGRADPEICES